MTTRTRQRQQEAKILRAALLIMAKRGGRARAMKLSASRRRAIAQSGGRASAAARKRAKKGR